MSWLLLLVALGVLLLPLVVSIRRSTELFKLRVSNGRLRFVRGRIPPGLLSDLEDVVRASPIEGAELRAIREGGRAEVVARGAWTPEQLQRVRNSVGLYSLQRIAAGQRPRRGRPNPR
jgi:hypothetical protein